MLTRSHYIHKCVHIMYFTFLKKYKTHIHGSNKTLDFSVRIKIDNELKAKLYIYIYILFLLFTDKVEKNIHKF